jgi:hypothetical protein
MRASYWRRKRATQKPTVIWGRPEFAINADDGPITNKRYCRRFFLIREIVNCAEAITIMRGAQAFRKNNIASSKRRESVLRKVRENVMLISDLIHSCSNEKVALAAMASIGGGFAERVGGAAQEYGVPAGRLIAWIVRDFGRRASEEMRLALQERVAGADQPLLHALRDIVENAIESGSLFFDDQAVRLETQAPDWRWRRLEAGAY